MTIKTHSCLSNDWKREFRIETFAVSFVILQRVEDMCVVGDECCGGGFVKRYHYAEQVRDCELRESHRLIGH